MRILPAVLLLSSACGPIYAQPQQQTQQQPVAPQGGPPGMAPDPNDASSSEPGTVDQWGQRRPARRQIGHDTQFDQSQQQRPAQPQPPQQPPAQPQQPRLSSDTQQLVDAHNIVRAKHCAPPLTWSPVLAAAAQKWANNLRDRNCAFEHSPNNSYGENLAGGSTGYLDPAGVVAMWYGESAKYDFKHPGFSMETGHFTQVVWRGSRQLGCARSTCQAQGQDIWVCEYDPPGNFEGEYPANVEPIGCR